MNTVAAWYKTLTLPLPWRRWRIIGHVDSGDEVPDKLPRRGVVLVGTAQQPVWAALDCPCGTGHRLLVNLDSRRYPRWELDSKPRLSLRPSIDAITRDRRCHFVLNQGKVRWIPDGRGPGQGRRRRRPMTMTATPSNRRPANHTRTLWGAASHPGPQPPATQTQGGRPMGTFAAQQLVPAKGALAAAAALACVGAWEKSAPRSCGWGSGQPRDRRRVLAVGLCSRLVLLLVVLTAAGFAAMSVASSSAAAAAETIDDQTEWTIVDPELSGSPEGWIPCNPGVGHGDDNCVYVKALGGEEMPTHCAIWYVALDEVRVGDQQIAVFVPHAHAAADTVYWVNSTSVHTDEPIRRTLRIFQKPVYGWFLFDAMPFDAYNVVIQMCNNEAEQHYDRDGVHGLIGVDAVAVRCVSRCDPNPLSAPTGLTTDSASYEDVTRVSWGHPTLALEAVEALSSFYTTHSPVPGAPRVSPVEGMYPTAKYYVRYSRDAYKGAQPWTSKAYTVVDPLHFSPDLWDGATYRVEVWAEDALGRQSAVASTHFVHQDEPDLGPGPHDPDVVEEVSQEVKDLRIARDVLDTVGIADPSPVSDLSSAAVSLRLGDYDEVMVSVVSLVPYLGDLSKSYKVTKRAAKAIKKANNIGVDALAKRVNPTKRLLNGAQAKTVKTLDEAGWYFRRADTVFEYRGYRYQTDQYGRTIAGWGRPKLQKPLVKQQDRNSHVKRLVRELGHLDENGKPIDTGGHVFAKMFGGEYTPYNIVPQSSGANRRLNELEQIWRNAIRDGKEVIVDIQIRYNPGNRSMRPDRFEVKYWIEGEQLERAKVIDNT